MRNIQFIIFFSTVITVFGLISFYIYSRGIQAFPVGTPGRFWFKAVFIFLSFSYIIARMLERVWLSVVSDIFTWIGSFWLAAFFYFLLICIAIDLVRLVDYIVPFIPDNWKSLTFVRSLVVYSMVFVALILLTGFINAWIPRTKVLEIEVDKKVKGYKTLSIAFASDIHLGTLVGPRRTKMIVNRLNGLNSDLILLGGDIVDEDLAPVIRNDLGAALAKLKAPLGVYGITGNHEYIGGVEDAVKYLEEHGITMIRDSSVLVDDRFYILGREDRDGSRFGGRERKQINEMVSDLDIDKPSIMMDHQPYDLGLKEEAGIDFTISGHTHHGQLWPLNFITKAIFEVSWGYKKKRNTHVYVSSGAGGWGPPVRVGNRPEIVNVLISFK